MVGFVGRRMGVGEGRRNSGVLDIDARVWIELCFILFRVVGIS